VPADCASELFQVRVNQCIHGFLSVK
jgi:hypothetical protein